MCTLSKVVLCMYVYVKLLSMSANRCSPGETSSAHTITLGMDSPTYRVLALLHVDLPALAHSVWLVQAPRGLTGSM